MENKNLKAIEVDNIWFTYEQNKSDTEETIKGVSFSIDKGSWVSIIGHNGSGKSTLAKLLVGLEEVSKGTIKISGVEMNEDNISKIRKNIGIVFQNPDNQFVGVTVKHDVAFGLENQNMPREEMLEVIDKVLKEVNMERYIDSEPQNLSGGEKQRVAIAGALAMNQEIIIFDEATSMLDPEGTTDIINIIKSLNKDYNKTVITITHDLNFAALSDRIIVLKGGEKALDDTVENVFKEEDLLVSSGLEIPMDLRLYNMVKKDENLKNNQKLIEELWKLSSKK